MTVEFDTADLPTSARPERVKALRVCKTSGCRRPAVLRESTCFDHIDPEALEEANRDTDDESIEERVARLDREQRPALRPWAPMASTGGEVKDVAKKDGEKLVCPRCGREYSNKTRGPHDYAQHIAGCKGEHARSGRISARAASSFSTSDEGAKQDARPSDPPRGRKASAKTKTRRAKPARKRSTVRRKGQRREPSARELVKRSPALRKAVRKAQAEIAEERAVTPARFLAALRAERDKIDEAIRAVEALA